MHDEEFDDEEFEGEMEIISEGGTLYREVKETGLSKTAHIIE